MRPRSFSFTMDVLDRNGVCETQTPSGSGNLTINGDLASDGVATFDIPRHAGIYSSGNESGRIFTITGTGRDGKVLTEDITGPDATTVNGSKNFKTMTQVAINGAAVGNVEVGTTDEFDSQIVPVDSYAAKISYTVYLSSGASLTYEFKYTQSDIFAAGFVEDDAVFISDIGPKTVNSDSRSDGPFRACRLEITGFASGTITWIIVTANK